MKWLVFAEGTKSSTIKWHLARHDDAVGYFLGVPPFLQEQSIKEFWDSPHIWIEEIPPIEEGGY